MAINQINGDLVGLWISTVLTNPATTDWKEVVCSTNTQLQGSASTTTTNTKCGTIKTRSNPAWTVTGSGVTNSTPTTGQVSGTDMVGFFQDNTPILIKMAHVTDTALFYREGQGTVGTYSEKADTGVEVTFDFTLEITGSLTLTA